MNATKPYRLIPRASQRNSLRASCPGVGALIERQLRVDRHHVVECLGRGCAVKRTLRTGLSNIPSRSIQLGAVPLVESPLELQRKPFIGRP
jgi:hypothetical protein